MKKRLLIILLAALAVAPITALALRNAPLTPLTFGYPLKTWGEWFDVNFLTISASGKQARHLELADRRVQEFLQINTRQEASAARLCQCLLQAYEKELARSEWMAEQLTLLDPELLTGIADVYEKTLAHIDALDRAEGDKERIAAFVTVAERYNSFAIKRLIQKHWNTPADEAYYRTLVLERIAIGRKMPNLSPNGRAALMQAEQIASTDQIEWAYDLASSAK